MGGASKSGFTFLEMLLAMAMMSMLAGSLYASLHIAFSTRDTAEAALQPVRAAGLAVEMLRQEIESSLPPVGILAGEFLGTDGQNDSGQDADTLRLHASAHESVSGERSSDIRKVEFAFELLSEGDEGVLVRRITTNLLAPEVPEPVEDVLCRNVTGLNFTYFDGQDWLDSWDSTTQGNTLPVAVQVSVAVGKRGEEGPQRGSYELSRLLILPCGGEEDGDGAAGQSRTQ